MPVGNPFGGRVHFSTDNSGLPFAFRPGEILTHDEHTDSAVRLLINRFGAEGVEAAERVDSHRKVKVPAVAHDAVHDAVHELRHAGLPAQPNHVFFAHGGGPAGGSGELANPVYASPVNASPVYASPVYASPVYASPVYASPVYASPVYASPVYASPVYASPVYASGMGLPRNSTVRPAVPCSETERLAEQMAIRPKKDAPTVYVLDTGLAAIHDRYIPTAIKESPGITAPRADKADPHDTREDLLELASGHSTFIAGLIQGVAGGTRVEVRKVLAGEGEGDELAIARTINDLSPADPQRAILNLSFGGYVLDHPYVLARAINRFMKKGGVVVASAGNDASSRPTYPATLPGVIGVGAVGPTGAASFTNYGPWVRACAPGVDLISSFFKDWKDASGNYEGWAIWSGTSFAAPLVAGSIARQLIAHRHESAQDAAAEVIDRPWLMRIPNLGTVVNVG